MDYQQKYLKYKNKYLELKGGGGIKMPPEDQTAECTHENSATKGAQMYKTAYTCNHIFCSTCNTEEYNSRKICPVCNRQYTYKLRSKYAPGFNHAYYWLKSE